MVHPRHAHQRPGLPYTTVLGARQYGATNLAQSCNGPVWICGPIVGSVYFYSKDALGHSTGSQTLYIRYAGIAIVVIVLAGVFYLADIPGNLFGTTNNGGTRQTGIVFKVTPQ
jgi:fucose permease